MVLSVLGPVQRDGRDGRLGLVEQGLELRRRRHACSIASARERGDGFGDRCLAGDEVEGLACGARFVEHRDEHRRDVLARNASAAGGFAMRSRFRCPHRWSACRVARWSSSVRHGPGSRRRQPLSRAGMPGIPDRRRWPAGRRPSRRSSDTGRRPRPPRHRPAGSPRRGRPSPCAPPRCPGPAPAANTTASAPRRCSATSSTEAFSRSMTTGSAPAASRSAACAGIADESRDRVAPLGEQAFQDEGDLPVASGDDDAHYGTPSDPGVLTSTRCTPCHRSSGSPF